MNAKLERIAPETPCYRLVLELTATEHRLFTAALGHMSTNQWAQIASCAEEVVDSSDMSFTVAIYNALMSMDE